MSDAIKALRDYLSKSPSVVYPQDVLEYLPTIEAENAQLREKLAKWEQLAAGIDLPEYPVTQFKPKDLERENSKLRELAKEMWSVMWACAEERCTHRENGCYRVSGNGTTPEGHGECWFKQRIRELGIEVDG